MIVPREPDRPRKIVVRNALWGGIAVLDVGLALTVGIATYDLGVALLASASTFLGVAGVISFIGLLFQQGSGGLNRVEADLEKSLRMLERGMINEEDYAQIKARYLERFQPAMRDIRGLLRVAVTVGAAAMAAPFLIALGNYTGSAAVFLTLLFAPVGAALVGMPTLLVQRLKAGRPLFGLTGEPKMRRMLGDADYSQE